MAELVAFSILSIDGHYSGPDGEFDWTIKDNETSKFSNDQTGGTGTILLGRKTYEMMQSYWTLPQAEEFAASTAAYMRNSAKIVFSEHSTNFSETDNWKNITHYSELEPEVIKNLKDTSGKNMIILGSGTIVKQLTMHSLIDEYQLMINPVILGKGKSFFTDLNVTRLKLKESKKFNNGIVLNIYRRS